MTLRIEIPAQFLEARGFAVDGGAALGCKSEQQLLHQGAGIVRIAKNNIPESTVADGR